jgi:hypothetical protein
VKTGYVALNKPEITPRRFGTSGNRSRAMESKAIDSRTTCISMKRATVASALCSLLLLEGCTAVYFPHPPVPQTPAEQVPAPPPSPVVLIWQPGHFDWNGVGYVWIPGQWVDRAGHGTLWQDGYWRRSGETSVWVPAHWI